MISHVGKYSSVLPILYVRRHVAYPGFLADRTNGRAYANVALRPSVCDAG